MWQKTIAYIKLLLLFQLCVEINCQLQPLERDYHTSTLIGDKLYILGGRSVRINVGDAGKDFFYLDVSVEFNTKNLLWRDLSSINTVPPHGAATSVKGGANNNTLFLYGGYNAKMEFVYMFNPQENSWNIPRIGGYNIKVKKKVRDRSYR
jgi:hypothetical protein